MIPAGASGVAEVTALIPPWGFLQLRVLFGVLHELHTEFVEAQVRNGHATVHVLQINYLGLEALELLPTVF